MKRLTRTPALKWILCALLLGNLAGCIIVPVGGHHGWRYEAPQPC